MNFLVQFCKMCEVQGNIGVRKSLSRFALRLLLYKSKQVSRIGLNAKMV